MSLGGGTVYTLRSSRSRGNPMEVRLLFQAPDVRVMERQTYQSQPPTTEVVGLSKAHDGGREITR